MAQEDYSNNTKGIENNTQNVDALLTNIDGVLTSLFVAFVNNLSQQTFAAIQQQEFSAASLAILINDESVFLNANPTYTFRSRNMVVRQDATGAAVAYESVLTYSLG
jgi:hypothetical protein